MPPDAGFKVTIATRIPVEPVSSSLTKVFAAALALVILVPSILPESSITKITSVVLGIFFPSTIRFIFHFPGVAVVSAVFSICTAPGFGHSNEVEGNTSVVASLDVVEPVLSALVLATNGNVNGATSPINTGPPSLSGSVCEYIVLTNKKNVSKTRVVLDFIYLNFKLFIYNFL